MILCDCPSHVLKTPVYGGIPEDKILDLKFPVWVRVYGRSQQPVQICGVDQLSSLFERMVI